MATVYLAIQESFQREVALKIMAPSLSDDESFSERFLHEARVVSRLIHPHIVTVHDVGISNGHHYLSMEYVPGRELKNCLAELTGDVILRVLSEVASALDYAGQKGYVHRDVKPENIMLHEESGRAVLMDFGIAKADDIGSGMTQTGMALGTPYYMSPEQARGKKVDGRADLYSLGIVFYKMLIGRVPYDGDSAVTIGIKHISEPVPELPIRLSVFQPVLNKLLAKDVAQRYQRGSELVADIEKLKAAGAVIDKSRKQCFNRDANKKSSVLDLSLSDQAKTLLMSGAKSSAGLDNEVSTRSVWLWLVPSSICFVVVGAYYTFFGLQFPPSDDKQLAALERLGLISKPKLTLDDIMNAKPESLAVDEATPSLAVDEYEEGVEESDMLSTQANDGIEAVVEPELSRFDQLLLQAENLELQYERGEVEMVALVAVYRDLLEEKPDYLPATKRLMLIQDEQLESVAVALDEDVFDADKLVEIRVLLSTAVEYFPELADSNRYQRYANKFTKLQEIEQTLLLADNYFKNGQYTTPEDTNAKHQYEKVLLLAPGHLEATKGLQEITAKYYQLAVGQERKKNYTKALQFIANGLSINAGHVELARLKTKVTRTMKAHLNINALLKDAQALEEQGQLFTGDSSAAVKFKQVLVMDANNSSASTGLNRLVDKLSLQIDEQLKNKQLDEALSLLQPGLNVWPDNKLLVALKRQIDALQPVIDVLKLSGEEITDLGAPLPKQFKAGRVLHIAFNYKNFISSTTVLQATLYDGGQTVQIAAVPVIVSGNEGEKIFKIKRPVEGFKAGGYRLEILLAGKRIVSQSFVVTP